MATWHEWTVDNSFKDITGTPAVTSNAVNRLSFFYCGADSCLHYKDFSFSNGRWNNLKTGILGVDKKIKGTPAAICNGPNAFDIFAWGRDDNHLYHIVFDGTNWQQWDNLGGRGTAAILTASPAAVASSKNRIDVFVRGVDNHMSTINWMAGGSWSEWKDLNFTEGKLLSAPAAAANGANLLDVFAVWDNGHLRHISTNDGSNWSAWDTLDGKGNEYFFNEAPAVASSKNRLDVFVRNAANSRLWHANWQKDVHLGWTVEDLGGTLMSPPTAVSWGADRVDCFAVTSGGLSHKFWGA
jgi:hypothetical protein